MLEGVAQGESTNVLATRFGLHAIDAVRDGDFGKMVALRGTLSGAIRLVFALTLPATFGLWALSRPALPTRLDLWTYFAAWIAVATSAASG